MPTSKLLLFFYIFAAMVKSAAALLMMVHFLVGSIALPLGDFTLLKELPRMYHAYQKVVAPDENSVLDFIGDYLLNGKDLLGHNQHDIPSKSGTVQFEHAATFAAVVHHSLPLITPVAIRVQEVHQSTVLPFALSDYHPDLFRPPLA